MEKVIKGKRYNTDTAVCVGVWTNGMMEEEKIAYYRQELYRKRNGEFFLYILKYGEEQIEPLSYEEADEWANRNLKTDKYQKLFKISTKNDNKTTLTIRMEQWAADEIKRQSNLKGLTAGQYIEMLVRADRSGRVINRVEKAKMLLQSDEVKEYEAKGYEFDVFSARKGIRLTKVPVVDGVAYIPSFVKDVRTDYIKLGEYLTIFDGYDGSDLKVTGGEGLDDMSLMFAGLKAERIDLTELDIDNVKYMNNMFYDCINLKEVKFGKVYTENLTHTSCMFSSCESLKEIDLSMIYANNIEYSDMMFTDCTKLEKIDMSGFSNKRGSEWFTKYMFQDCVSLKEVKLDSDFKIRKEEKVFINTPDDVVVNYVDGE